MLLRVCWRRQYNALQHADAIVCGALTCNGMCRGEKKSFVERGGWMVKCVVSDVCRDEMLVCYYECVGGVNTVHCNTLM